MNTRPLLVQGRFIWAAILIVALLSTGLMAHGQETPAAAQDSTDHSATVAAAIAAFQDGDVATLESLYAADYAGHLAQSSERDDLTRDDLTEISQLLTTSLTDIHITTEAIVADSTGDLAASRVTLSGMFTEEFYDYPPTGAPVEIEVQILHRFNDEGQIVEEWFAYDNYWVMQQLGVLETGE